MRINWPWTGSSSTARTPLLNPAEVRPSSGAAACECRKRSAKPETLIRPLPFGLSTLGVKLDQRRMANVNAVVFAKCTARAVRAWQFALFVILQVQEESGLPCLNGLHCTNKRRPGVLGSLIASGTKQKHYENSFINLRTCREEAIHIR